MKRMTGMFVAAAMLVTAASTVLGEEPQGWQFEIAPYGWLAGLSGDVSVGGQKSEFKKSASDLFDALDVGGSLLAVAQYNRVLFEGQFDYFSLSTTELDVENQPPGGSLDSDLLIGKLGIGYQFGDNETTTVDLLLGVQSMNMDNTLNVTGAGSSTAEVELIDPVLLLKMRSAILPSTLNGWYFNLPLMIGGGGLGDSDLVYGVEAQLQYAFNSTIDARVGYRIEGYQFEEENAETDLALAGWTVGLGFRF